MICTHVSGQHVWTCVSMCGHAVIYRFGVHTGYLFGIRSPASQSPVSTSPGSPRPELEAGAAESPFTHSAPTPATGLTVLLKIIRIGPKTAQNRRLRRGASGRRGPWRGLAPRTPRRPKMLLKPNLGLHSKLLARGLSNFVHNFSLFCVGMTIVGGEGVPRRLARGGYQVEL